MRKHGAFLLQKIRDSSEILCQNSTEYKRKQPTRRIAANCNISITYEYVTYERYIEPSIYEMTIAKFKKVCYNEFEAQIKAMEYLSVEYGFSFKEVK